MPARLVLRLLLACCLLLQVVTPLWACQHDAGSPGHHCCDGPGTPSDTGDKAPECRHCFGHGQTWNFYTPSAGPVFAGGVDRWRLSRESGPPPFFPDRLFKPPIFVPGS